MLLSAILPTRGRGPQSIKCIERYIYTVKDFDVEFIIMAHPDESNEIWKNHGLGPKVRVEFIDAPLMTCYNIGASISNGQFLFDFDDDSWPNDDWFVKVMQTFDSIPNRHGYVKIRSDNPYGDWAERAIGNREFYKEVLGGVISIPHYFSQYNDVEKSDRARAANLFFESDAYIEHRTWVYGKAKMDETYQRSRQTVNNDQHIYNTRKAAGFPNDYQAVI